MADPAIYLQTEVDFNETGPLMRVFGRWYVSAPGVFNGQPYDIGGYDATVYIPIDNTETAQVLNTKIRDAALNLPLTQNQPPFTAQQVRYKQWTRG